MYDDIWYSLIIIVKPSKNLLQNFIRYQLQDNYARIALLVWVWQKFWTLQSVLWIWALLLSTGLEWKRMWWKNGRSRPSRLCVQICWSQQVKKGQERKVRIKDKKKSIIETFLLTFNRIKWHDLTDSQVIITSRIDWIWFFLISGGFSIEKT